MNDIRPEHKKWARHLRENVPGSDVRVTRHDDEGQSHHIDIFTSTNEKGVVAATIGLMDHDQSQNPRAQVFSEVLIDVRGCHKYIGNVTATIAFCVMKDGRKVAPGVVFEEVVEMYDPAASMKHVLFVPPFQWEDGMTRVDLGAKTIHPLLAVPITETEMQFVRGNGADALETLWAESECDVLDWGRETVA